MDSKNYSNSNTLLNIYDEDIERLEHRIGKDRAKNTLHALLQGRNYVASFLNEQMECNDIPINDVSP